MKRFCKTIIHVNQHNIRANAKNTTELEKLSNIGAAQAQYIPCIEGLQSRHVKLFGVRFVPTEEQFEDVLVV